MKIRLLSVGKPKDEVAVRLHQRYADRLTRLGVRYDTEWVSDVQPGGRYSDDHVREREARLLLDRLENKGTVVALHSEGDLIRTGQLAERFQRWAFPWTMIVGGPLGLHRILLDRVDWSWSLSPLTFPHELVRGLVAEQLYRAVSILRNLPYHK